VAHLAEAKATGFFIVSDDIRLAAGALLFVEREEFVAGGRQSGLDFGPVEAFVAGGVFLEAGL
jgi:hypothetical protein